MKFSTCGVATGVLAAGLMAGLTVIGMPEPALAQDRPSQMDAVKARQKISMMEGVLERAVNNGADNMFRAVRTQMPMSEGLRLIGTPQVSGFRLDGYGVFFDVEVPQLLMPLAWTFRYMDQSDPAAGSALAAFREVIPQISDPQERARLEQVFTRLEMAVGPAATNPTRMRAGLPTGPTLAAQSLNVAPASAVPVPRPAQPRLEDPNVAYTREVQSALIEAMIENSGPMSLGPDEWLVVAARDSSVSDRTVVTGDSTEVHTIMLRVKGGDLAAFRAGTITMDEALKRVEVRED